MTENIPATDSPAFDEEQPVTDPNTNTVKRPTAVVVGVESVNSPAATAPGMESEAAQSSRAAPEGSELRHRHYFLY